MDRREVDKSEQAGGGPVAAGGGAKSLRIKAAPDHEGRIISNSDTGINETSPDPVNSRQGCDRWHAWAHILGRRSVAAAASWRVTTQQAASIRCILASPAVKTGCPLRYVPELFAERNRRGRVATGRDDPVAASSQPGIFGQRVDDCSTSSTTALINKNPSPLRTKRPDNAGQLPRNWTLMLAAICWLSTTDKIYSL